MASGTRYFFCVEKVEDVLHEVYDTICDLSKTDRSVLKPYMSCAEFVNNCKGKKTILFGQHRNVSSNSACILEKPSEFARGPYEECILSGAYKEEIEL